MQRLSTERGRTADRIATIDPLELHRSICDAAVDALRNGAPLERLDGLEYFEMRTAGVAVQDSNGQRRALLEASIARQRQVADQARSNANASSNERLRAEFMQDAEAALSELEVLEQQLDELDNTPQPSVVPEKFTAEIDYIAHCLARLASTRTTRTAEFGEAVNQVVTDLRILPNSASRKCDVEFSLMLPAGGMVLRFGPIRTTVANRAYVATLPDDVRLDAPRLVLSRQALAHQLVSDRSTSDHEVLQAVRRKLVDHGYTDLAAGTIVRSDSGPLYAIAANDLWGEPLPDDYDPRYVELVLSTYRNPDFQWNPRHYSVDCTMRQQLVEALVAKGGEAPLLDVISDLATTKVDDQRIAVFSRAQSVGNAPSWEPCVQRVGDWRQQSSRQHRSLKLSSCPHCGGTASRVVRVPEVPACVLCPGCKRMPTATSPVFPEEYLA